MQAVGVGLEESRFRAGTAAARAVGVLEPISPMTKYAILGVVFGVVVLPLFGVVSGQFGLVAGHAGGFLGGLAGGIVWGLATRFANARS
jgi:hypothetical protein